MVSASGGGEYSQQLEALTIMKIQHDPRTQFWINLNTEIAKWINQREQLILMEEWNSEASKLNT